MTYSSTRIMETLKEATAEQHRDAERRQLQKEMVRGELAPETYAASGPFDERTFGFEASLRFEGVDPRANRIFHPTSM